MKASEITADALLYWDPATAWLNAPSSRATKVRVLDPVARHWICRGRDFEALPRRSVTTTFGILVEVWAGDPHWPGRKQIVALNALRGPYEQVAVLVEAQHQKRLNARHIGRELNLEQARRQERVIAAAAAIGIEATALFPGTTIQVPIEQFEAMVDSLYPCGCRSGQPTSQPHIAD